METVATIHILDNTNEIQGDSVLKHVFSNYRDATIFLLEQGYVFDVEYMTFFDEMDKNDDIIMSKLRGEHYDHCEEDCMDLCPYKIEYIANIELMEVQ